MLQCCIPFLSQFCASELWEEKSLVVKVLCLAASPLALYTRILQQCALSVGTTEGLALTSGHLVGGLQRRLAIKVLSRNGSHHGQSGSVTARLLLLLAAV